MIRCFSLLNSQVRKKEGKGRRGVSKFVMGVIGNFWNCADPIYRERQRHIKFFFYFYFFVNCSFLVGFNGYCIYPSITTFCIEQHY